MINCVMKLFGFFIFCVCLTYLCKFEQKVISQIQVILYCYLPGVVCLTHTHCTLFHLVFDTDTHTCMSLLLFCQLGSSSVFVG